MKENKGFTLIELLAVIVILAIIALIATPIVLNIIGNAKKSAIDSTADLIRDEIKLAYADYMSVPGATAKSADDFCQYMTSSYFRMDNLDEQISCTGTTATIKSNGTTYTAAYSSSTGQVEISYSGGNKATKTVTMK